MTKQKIHTNERGVVLITCLIFLILLLTLMRFTIGSAKMSEMKVGADFDELRAQASANLTFNDAERMIQMVDANGVSLLDPNVNMSTPGAVMNLAINYWRDSANFDGQAGIYDGDTEPCTNQLCTNHVGNWQLDCNSANKPFICYGERSQANKMSKNQGKFIIERFADNGAVLNMQQALRNTSTQIMVFRVTGIGYSDPTVNANNATNTIRQNTYILTSQ